MKKLATTAVAALALAGISGASVSSGAAGSDARERTHHVKRLVLKEVETHSPAQNQFLGADRYRSKATHEIVGYDSFTGSFDPDTGRVKFWSGISLRGGLIVTFVNTPAGDPTFTGRIVSGTGRYRGIEGTVFGRPMPEQSKALIILRYTL